MKTKTKKSWTLRVNPRKPFIDPRLPISRQIGWQRTAGDVTHYSVPEPDNYNRAIFSSKPVECPAIKDQVIYYDETRRGWFNVACVNEQELEAYNKWLETIDFTAYWQHDDAAAVRFRAAE